jgi:hypothetical protein
MPNGRSAAGKNAAIDWPAESLAVASCHWYATKVAAVSGVGAATAGLAGADATVGVVAAGTDVSGGVLREQPAMQSAATTSARRTGRCKGILVLHARG